MSVYVWGIVSGAWQMIVVAVSIWALMWVLYDWAPLNDCFNEHGVKCEWQPVPINSVEGVAL